MILREFIPQPKTLPQRESLKLSLNPTEKTYQSYAKHDPRVLVEETGFNKAKPPSTFIPTKNDDLSPQKISDNFRSIIKNW
jgi:hypothetical protein